MAAINSGAVKLIPMGIIETCRQIRKIGSHIPIEDILACSKFTAIGGVNAVLSLPLNIGKACVYERMQNKWHGHPFAN